MKLNNKGFAISSIMYIILVMAVILIALTLALLSSRNLMLEKIKEDVIENITPKKICELLSDTDSSATITKGDKYSCKVDPNKEPYIFYVLTNPVNLNEINLIMDSNINKNGEPIKSSDATDKGLTEWILQTDFIAVGGEDRSNDDGPCEIGGIECADPYLGPITAMNYLENATQTWTNLNKLVVNNFTDNSSNTHKMAKSYGVYARMPHYSELASIYDSSNLFLYEYLDLNNTSSWYSEQSFEKPTNNVSGINGYWSDSFSYYNASCAISLIGNYSDGGIECFMSIYDGSYTDVNTGVRPVITIKVDNIKN